MTLLDAALAWHHAGCSVVPVRTDGTKMPAVAWKAYQEQPASEAVVTEWFTSGRYDGLGVICGAVSGHLELFEVEGRAVTETLPAFRDAMRDNGYSDLWDRLNGGFLEQSPSGGMHWLFRVDGEARRNLKLARRPVTDAELAQDPDDKVKVLLETRGEGGYVVVAPSAGRTHPTGKAWTMLVGSPATIPTITADERDALHAIASMFDLMPVAEPIQPAMSFGGTSSGTRPGDDFNQRASWDDILTAQGWTRTKHFGGNCYGWVRPGKNARDGISATTGRNDGDNLFVFSSSTEFDTERPYSKFSAYTLLEWNGDYSAAAKQLRADGYGDQPPPEPGRPVIPPIHGNLAPVFALPDIDDRPVAVVDERTLDHSDDSNALLLIERFGSLIRYIPERGRWVAWDGQRWHWCPKGGGVVREYAKRIARSLPEEEKAERAHKKRSLSSNGTTAMIVQTETDDRITTNFDELDAHPYELNTPAGIVNLRTGAAVPSDPARLHTRMTQVAPDRDQPTPKWCQFLADTFEGSDDVMPFVQRLAGYSATGAVTHHVLPFLHGPGGNGKTVFLDVLRELLGDYAGTAPAKFLMSAQQQHETEIARLAGLRMVICSEVNQNDKFDEAKVKLLTGGDALTARFMHQDHFTFVPTHHLWLMGNHQPKVSSGGESFWRRVRIIAFANTVTEEKKIDGLAATLIREEGPGILAWIIAGAQQVIASGLQAPDSVMAATDTYATEEDTFARFVADRCHVGGGALVRTLTSELRAAYTRWCAAEGEEPFTTQVFGRELRTRYKIEQKRSNGLRYYLGITLYRDEDEPEDPDRGRYR